ncbi:hypothetical protein F2Q68_00041577 [Brassica cretica]|uniref:Uncharacterized protein n=1 Tax=Brassica cretica TaxID=69181 RepID=A0A8S9MH78_BRACR|nr:hypothetical protein F2Q68_00041577 [Brassica cretica]
MADARRDGENVDEPPVQRIALDQVQFQAMLADVTHQLRGHVEQIYAQANPREVDPACIAGKVRGALARQPIRARRGEQAEEDEEREELADEEDGRGPHRELPSESSRDLIRREQSQRTLPNKTAVDCEGSDDADLKADRSP